jgi:hypothetical protein
MDKIDEMLGIQTTADKKAERAKGKENSDEQTNDHAQNAGMGKSLISMIIKYAQADAQNRSKQEINQTLNK